MHGGCRTVFLQEASEKARQKAKKGSVKTLTGRKPKKAKGGRGGPAEGNFLRDASAASRLGGGGGDDDDEGGGGGGGGGAAQPKSKVAEKLAEKKKAKAAALAGADKARPKPKGKKSKGNKVAAGDGGVGQP
eukprot:SAG22_NODE_3932_length_1464_cov_1.461538_1_plen_132_part_00